MKYALIAILALAGCRPMTAEEIQEYSQHSAFDHCIEKADFASNNDAINIAEVVKACTAYAASRGEISAIPSDGFGAQ